MSAHVDEQLSDLVMGVLPAEERARVEAHLGECRRCAAEWLAAEEALALFACSLPPEAPPAALKARLEEAARAEPPGLGAALCRIFQIARERASWLLDQIKTSASWEPGPLPGMGLLHFEPGPLLTGADAGLISFPGGLRFPRHTHLGREIMVTLAGGYREGDGIHHGVGDLLEMAEGSSHELLIDEGGCVAAVLLYTGIDVAGLGPIYVKQG